MASPLNWQWMSLPGSFALRLDQRCLLDARLRQATSSGVQGEVNKQTSDSQNHQSRVEVSRTSSGIPRLWQRTIRVAYARSRSSIRNSMSWAILGI